MKVKSYGLFVEDNMKDEVKQFEGLFEYRKQFECFTIYEKDNVIASIENGTNDIKPILTVNKWEEDNKEITHKMIAIFNRNGWSDNYIRYKL